MSGHRASCSSDRRDHRPAHLTHVCLVLLAVVGTTACGVEDGDSTTIEMHDGNRFSPSTVRVVVGTTVVWSNASSRSHTVTTDQDAGPSVGAPDGATPFDSGRIGPGETFSHRFDEAGVYVFACGIHGDDGMVGVVSVSR
jgi:plastocyanin